MKQPKSVSEILALKNVPVVAIDQTGKFYSVNHAFTKLYGWDEDQLIGKMVTEIMPENMRASHTIGFSRFLTTEQPTVAGQPLLLPVLCKDGSVVQAVHFILGEKLGDLWHFAAAITKE